MGRESKFAEPMPDDGNDIEHYDWAQAALNLALADTDQLDELVSAANLSPESGDLSDIDLSDLDLSGQNMSGWDLRNAKFRNTKLTRASLQKAIVDPVALVEAADWRKAKLSKHLRQAATRAELLSRDIVTLGLSSRTEAVLRTHNIRTIGELVSKRDGQLLRMQDFGRRSLSDVRNRLTHLKLYLGTVGNVVNLMDELKRSLEREVSHRRSRSSESIYVGGSKEPAKSARKRPSKR